MPKILDSQLDFESSALDKTYPCPQIFLDSKSTFKEKYRQI